MTPFLSIGSRSGKSIRNTGRLIQAPLLVLTAVERRLLSAIAPRAFLVATQQAAILKATVSLWLRPAISGGLVGRTIFLTLTRESRYNGHPLARHLQGFPYFRLKVAEVSNINQANFAELQDISLLEESKIEGETYPEGSTFHVLTSQRIFQPEECQQLEACYEQYKASLFAV